MEQDQAFVEYVVKAIVNNPDKVKAVRTVDERGVLITLDVDPSDMAYVIGRQGQTARSVRTLLKIVGAKNNARVNLKINEPEGGRGPAYRNAAPAAAPAPTSTMSDEDIDTSAVDGFTL
ncbi:MAG: RNA-binding protein [Candidatus Magasanikbacteria bacterium CG10_big_fil_rev_8_21_14_0_10_42_10]|uniref:RNA-binding protein KhpA n=2 Tax=Candidatus Magasanikiibacteriota TaxID=1752731 RepID=A0A2H0TVN5_9BACT|nr:MAG: RNA-binding protein [Candidatus Magasanikbacteria bacterium CG10_big_fil_rev_8_21_14_0_10_42_10]PIZ93903.1 MAG: RNA-binding protein [Candidatus Magasanikbacteria bacterium CG_4_10_14_0_2_um_filter_41_10]